MQKTAADVTCYRVVEGYLGSERGRKGRWKCRELKKERGERESEESREPLRTVPASTTTVPISGIGYSLYNLVRVTKRLSIF